jgi:3-hydroxybutyryl-CoA dehydrogenase
MLPRSAGSLMSEIRTVTVVGAGTMGRGIAQVAAAAGLHVFLHDLSAELIHGGLEAIRSTLDEGIGRGKLAPAERDVILGRIEPAPVLAEAASRSELVIEAVPESLELKQRVFRELDRAAPPGAVLATNTSSLSVGRIAGVTSRPERVVGMHFFNPVHLMPLVEVVRAAGTSEDTVGLAVQTGRRLGKEPIVVGDSPGFASSRLGVALGLEAMRMVEQGVASAEDVDKAMTLGYRHPMGPLRVTDLVGLDTRLAIAEHLHRELGSDVFRPPEILRRMVADGKLGKKAGRGFYEW